MIVGTDRLILREWRDGDREPFLRHCNVPAVMEHLGGVAEEAAIDASIARIRACQAANGHGFWAVERREDGVFLGFCGLKISTDAGTPITGDVEIGWRLREDAWGRGYAREAAAASLAWGFANLAAPRIVAITLPANTRSWGLMERIGMVRRAELDCDHPLFAEGSPLRRHITYAAERPPG